MSPGLGSVESDGPRFLADSTERIFEFAYPPNLVVGTPGPDHDSEAADRVLQAPEINPLRSNLKPQIYAGGHGTSSASPAVIRNQPGGTDT